MNQSSPTNEGTTETQSTVIRSKGTVASTNEASTDSEGNTSVQKQGESTYIGSSKEVTTSEEQTKEQGTVATEVITDSKSNVSTYKSEEVSTHSQHMEREKTEPSSIAETEVNYKGSSSATTMENEETECVTVENLETASTTKEIAKQEEFTAEGSTVSTERNSNVLGEEPVEKSTVGQQSENREYGNKTTEVMGPTTSSENSSYGDKSTDNEYEAEVTNSDLIVLPGSTVNIPCQNADSNLSRGLSTTFTWSFKKDVQRKGEILANTESSLQLQNVEAKRLRVTTLAAKQKMAN
ncbi:unnamed protein product [Callosobruchus maculatus]|uniref:Uncharacterized protein n=1 Tax=Callosobruchus maculatus TaxID=64391 RepID=A0A653D9Z7_CALMS|nr:unnamed protein product [Callosobruchus maculatus]